MQWTNERVRSPPTTIEHESNLENRAENPIEMRASQFAAQFRPLTWQCPRCCSMDGEMTTMLPRHVTVSRKPLIKFSNASVVGRLILNWDDSLPLPNTKFNEKWTQMSMIVGHKCCKTGETYRNWCVRCEPKTVARQFCPRVEVNRPHVAPSSTAPESIHSIYHDDSSRLDSLLHDRCYCDSKREKNETDKQLIS